MEPWIKTTLLFFAVFNFAISVVAFFECKNKDKAFGQTPLLYPLGMYVWGDALIFGFFWGMAALISFFLSDAVLFLLIISVFWLVRSVGETIYWFNQQFSTVIRNKQEVLPFHNIFHNDSIWFIAQIANQCLTVITIITSVYLFKIWLS